MTRRISVRLTGEQGEHMEYESRRRKQSKSDVVREMLEVFPQLSERDIRNVRAYVSLYPDEVQAAIRQADTLDEPGVRERYPYLFPPRETP